MAGMNTKNWRRSAMLGVALAAIALPVAAMAQDAEGDHGRHGGRGDGGEAPGQIGEQHSWRQQAPAQTPSDDDQRQRGSARRAAPEAQAQTQVQTQADVRGGWRGRGDGGGAQVDVQTQAQAGGWRGRGGDASDGGRHADRGASGRDRNDGGATAGPSPQPNPQTRSGSWGQRNGTYTDPQRGGSYRDRDDHRDGRTADNWRDRRDNRDGNRSGSGDQWRRDGYRSGSGDQWGRDGYGYGGGQQTWNRGWRRDNRYDWNSYRSRNRSIFNIGVYYSPYRNYSYRRLSIGFTLGSLFYSDRYWINDPWQYRLPEVYGPYRWVRYYDDALLVDIYSGEVVDTIYDFFY